MPKDYNSIGTDRRSYLYYQKQSTFFLLSLAILLPSLFQLQSSISASSVSLFFFSGRRDEKRRKNHETQGDISTFFFLSSPDKTANHQCKTLRPRKKEGEKNFYVHAHKDKRMNHFSPHISLSNETNERVITRLISDFLLLFFSSGWNTKQM